MCNREQILRKSITDQSLDQGHLVRVPQHAGMCASTVENGACGVQKAERRNIV